MGKFITRILVNAVALSAAAYIVPGITLTGGFVQILLVALVFGLINAFLKPIAMILSLPFLLLSLGLFTFVVNGAMLLITARLTAHLAVAGLWSAILGSLVISLVSLLAGGLLEDDEPDR